MKVKLFTVILLITILFAGLFISNNSAYEIHACMSPGCDKM